MIGIARAHTNIALIKYWGKRDKALFLPMTSSLSLTLDAFYTDTKVVFDPNLTQDSFTLNGQSADPGPVTRFLDLFRAQMTQPAFARVESLNFVPTAAGLASSASAFAALAGACNQASGLNLDPETLSTYARLGSGSATRSLFGGFVEWDKGTGPEDSKAHFIDDASWDIGMMIIIVNAQQKKVSSRLGMEATVKTSPFYPAWVAQTALDLSAIKEAIARKDFTSLGQITEANGMRMHATTLGANPPFTYFEPESLVAQDAVRALRAKGYPAYFTMDAGPNVKVLCQASDLEAIRKELLETFREDQLVSTLPGPGLAYLSQEDWEVSNLKFKEISHETV